MTLEQKKRIQELVQKYRAALEKAGIRVDEETILKNAEKRLAIQERAQAVRKKWEEWDNKAKEFAHQNPIPKTEPSEKIPEILNRCYPYFMTGDPVQDKQTIASLGTVKGRKAFYQQMVKDLMTADSRLYRGTSLEKALEVYEKNAKIAYLGWACKHLAEELKKPEYQLEEPLQSAFMDNYLLYTNAASTISSVNYMAREEYLIFPDFNEQKVEPKVFDTFVLDLLVVLGKESTAKSEEGIQDLTGTDQFAYLYSTFTTMAMPEKKMTELLSEKKWDNPEIVLRNEKGERLNKRNALKQLADPKTANKKIIEEKLSPEEAKKLHLQMRKRKALEEPTIQELHQLKLNLRAHIGNPHTQQMANYLLDDDIYNSKTRELLPISSADASQEAKDAGTDKEVYADHLQKDFEAIGMYLDRNRESAGCYLQALMIGQNGINGKPLYSIEDVMDPDKLQAEKKAFGRKLREELAPLPSDATPERKQRQQEFIRQIDMAFLRGTDRLSNEVEYLAKDALQNPDSSAYLGTYVQSCMAVYLQLGTDCYDKSPGLKERIREIEKNGPVTDSGSTYQQLKDRTFVSSIFRAHSDNFNSTGTLFTGTSTGDFSAMISNFFSKSVLDWGRRRLAENPGCSLEELFSTQEESIAMDPEATGLEENVDFPSDWSSVPEFMKNNPNAPLNPLLEYLQHVQSNPALRAGALLMNSKGQLFANSHMEWDSKNKHIASISLNLPTDEQLMREAYLNHMQQTPKMPTENKLFCYAPASEKEPYGNDRMQERLSQLQDSLKELNDVESAFRTSGEWKKLKTKLGKAISFQRSLPANPTDEQKLQLDELLQDVQMSAVQYIVHKVHQRGLLGSPKDMERLNAVKKLDNLIHSDRLRTEPVAKPMRKQRNEALRKHPFEKTGLQEQARLFGEMATMLEGTRRTGDGSSPQFTQMVGTLKTLAESAKSFGDQENLTVGARKTLGGYFRNALKAVNAYLGRKAKVNNGSEASLTRIEAATQLQELMGSMEPAIINTLKTDLDAANKQKQERHQDRNVLNDNRQVEENRKAFGEKKKEAIAELKKGEHYLPDGTVKPESKDKVMKALFTLYTAAWMDVEQGLTGLYQEKVNEQAKSAENEEVPGQPAVERLKPPKTPISDRVLSGHGEDAIKALMKEDESAKKYLGKMDKKQIEGELKKTDSFKGLVKHVREKELKIELQQQEREESQRLQEIKKGRTPVRQFLVDLYEGKLPS